MNVGNFFLPFSFSYEGLPHLDQIKELRKVWISATMIKFKEEKRLK
jgi:hypothetical protein